MGFRISWLAAQTSKAVLLRALHMTDTGVADEANEAPFSVTQFPNGWSLVWANDADWANPSRIPALSETLPVVACMVDETVMASAIDYAGSGESWSVAYGVEEEGVLEGNWPPAFAPVVEAALQQKLAEDADGHGTVDHAFDIPIEVGRLITGYRYDTWQYEWEEPSFTIAEVNGAD